MIGDFEIARTTKKEYEEMREKFMSVYGNSFLAYQKEWMRHAFSIERIDKFEVTDAVAAIYRFMGRPMPKIVFAPRPWMPVSRS